MTIFKISTLIDAWSKTAKSSHLKVFFTKGVLKKFRKIHIKPTMMEFLFSK